MNSVPAVIMANSWMRSCGGCHGWVIQRASAVSHILIQTLLTSVVAEAPSFCHPVSVSGDRSGYLAWDERNSGSGGAVGKSDWVELRLETLHTAVHHIRLS